MRWVVIILGVVAIGFVAFMLIGSNESEPPEGFEPPGFFGWLDSLGGAPRLVEKPVSIPDDGGWTLAVPRACGTPARIATLEIKSGAYVSVAYECRADAPRDCRGPVELCRDQVFCLASAEGASICPSDREEVTEADVSFGPEGGLLRITAPLGGTASVELR
ncbi:MAG: hypothetical protein IT535_13835 [Bauldia sp.]|nr:hypothetical protein [Bauldia sp.]